MGKEGRSRAGNLSGMSTWRGDFSQAGEGGATSVSAEECSGAREQRVLGKGNSVDQGLEGRLHVWIPKVRRRPGYRGRGVRVRKGRWRVCYRVVWGRIGRWRVR